MTVHAAEGLASRTSSRDSAMIFGWLTAAVALVGATLWLASIPPSLSSDDALFLTRGLTRFSILDFSPQFPGYPGLVAMGRAALLVAHDPLSALSLTSAAVALAIPPAAAWVAWRITRAAWAAFAAFFVALLGPLMPDLAVSLLSDGAGILFLLVFLALLPRRAEAVRPRLVAAGLALGWAFACRPSDAPLFAGAFVAIAVTRPRWIVAILVGAAVVVLPVAAVIFALEGGLYWEEGLRFVSGHAGIWGNTPFAAGGQGDSWLTALAAVPFAVALVLLMLAGIAAAVVTRPRAPALMALLAAFGTHAVWIVAFQNPDHLRHLAPPVVLGGIAFVAALETLQLRRIRLTAVAVLVAVEVATLAATGTVAAMGEPAPLAAATVWLAAHQPLTLATNEGVFTLRDALPAIRIYDAHYPADAALGLSTASGPAFRLTETPLAGADPAAVFAARFPGERTLYLYPAR